MHLISRLAAIVAGAAVFALVATPVAARPIAHEHDHNATLTAAARPAGGSADPCADPAFRLIGGKWQETYRWWFNAASTPDRLNPTAVRDVFQKSFSNITEVNNDCGLPDNVSATHSFMGRTQRAPRCSRMDGMNVVGFKRLRQGVLGVTCFWTFGNRIVEADMAINSRVPWTLSLAGCVRKVMLEATVTHEAGHVFGLDHVREGRHGQLTMSPLLNGACQNSEATLGLGDVKGLEALY